MSFNWVRMKMTTRDRDRAGGHEVSYIGPFDDMFHTMAPNHRKATKKLSRKEMRREHAKIIREELRYRDADATAEREEQIRLNQEADDLWYAELAAEYEYGLSDDEAYELDHPMYDEPYYDPFWDIEYNSSPYDYDHNPYDNEDRSYVGGSLTKQGLTSFDMNARITDQDAGKTLGEILEEIGNGFRKILNEEKE